MESQEEISLWEIVNYLREGIWLILAGVIIGAMAVGAGTLVLEEDVYEASSSLLMTKEMGQVLDEWQYTKNDIDLYQQTGNTYMEIANSNTVLDETVKILEKQGIYYSRNEIRNMVSSQHISGTVIIKLTAKSSEGEFICAVAEAHRASFIEVANQLLPVSSLKVIDSAEVPSTPKASKVKMNTLIGGMLGGILPCGIIFMKCILDMGKIGTVEEIKDLLDLEVIVHIK